VRKLRVCNGIVLVEWEDQLCFGGHRFSVYGCGLKAPGLDRLKDNLVQHRSHAFDEIFTDDLAEGVDADIDDNFLFGGGEESAVGDGRVRRKDGERGVDVLGVAAVAGESG